MKCTFCDSPAGATARFCASCGAALCGDDLSRRIAAARGLEAEGRLEEAAVAYERLLEGAGASGNASLWHDLGVVQYYLADLRGAVDSLRRALGLDPGLHLAGFWLGNALYHLGDLAGATHVFRHLVERHPNFAIARFHLGVIYARQGLREAAEDEFRQVLLDHPEDAAARYYVS